jgi:hypothetical protein
VSLRVGPIVLAALLASGAAAAGTLLEPIPLECDPTGIAGASGGYVNSAGDAWVSDGFEPEPASSMLAASGAAVLVGAALRRRGRKERGRSSTSN